MKLGFLQLFKRGNSNLMKILLLGSGLAMGLVLVAKIYFERTYDDLVPHIDRTYKIVSLFGQEGKQSEFGQTAGAIAHGIEAYSPVVESATRINVFHESVKIKRIASNGSPEDGVCVIRDAAFVDTSFFDIFSQHVHVGNPHVQMNEKSNAMISRSFAERLVGNGKSYMEALGMTVAIDYKVDKHLTVCGIFEDFPANSTFKNIEMLLSMPTLGLLWGYDGSNNWVGNEGYLSYIRLREGASSQEVRDGIYKMCQLNFPLEEMEKAGVNIDFRLASMQTLHTEDPDVHKAIQILSLLSFVILFAAAMNYILIAVSAMTTRAKVMAIHKCFGASKADIYKMILPEVLVHIVLSVLVAAFLTFVARNVVEDIMGTSILSMLQGNSIFVLILVCLFVFLMCGVVQGYLYANVPETAAYRVNKEKSYRWKYGSLFIQFAASSFFLALLLLVARQYSMMLGSDLGYTFDKLVFVDESALNKTQREAVDQEFAKLPFVEMQAHSTTLPISWMGGNNVRLPNDPKDLFNIADQYSVSDNFLDLMQVPLVEGRYFTQSDSSIWEVLVSRRFAEQITKVANWTDGCVGKQVIISEHSDEPSDLFTICGVYENYVIGSASRNDGRPSALFYKENNMSNHLVKLSAVTAENVQQLDKTLHRLFPEIDLETFSYATRLSFHYADSRRFKDSVMLAGAIVLLITLLGLIGYARDEANRRRKEIAIRKINGAPISVLINLFLGNIMKLAIPSVVVGCVLGYWVADHWLAQFASKVDNSIWPYLLCAIVVLLLLAIVVVSVTYKAANANPVKNLKSE